MTREDIIRMAREAGFEFKDRAEPKLEHFFQAAYAAGAAAEREACAKVCEAYTDNDDGRFIDYEGHGYECAAAIRARG